MKEAFIGTGIRYESDEITFTPSQTCLALHDAKQNKERSRSKVPVMPVLWDVVRPVGGGLLDSEYKASEVQSAAVTCAMHCFCIWCQGYFIVGSWSNWREPEEMDGSSAEVDFADCWDEASFIKSACQ